MKILLNHLEEMKNLATKKLPAACICSHCHSTILIEDSNDIEIGSTIYNGALPSRSEFFWSCPVCDTKNAFSPASYK